MTGATVGTSCYTGWNDTVVLGRCNSGPYCLHHQGGESSRIISSVFSRCSLSLMRSARNYVFNFPFLPCVLHDHLNWRYEPRTLKAQNFKQLSLHFNSEIYLLHTVLPPSQNVMCVMWSSVRVCCVVFKAGQILRGRHVCSLYTSSVESVRTTDAWLQEGRSAPPLLSLGISSFPYLGDQPIYVSNISQFLDWP